MDPPSPAAPPPPPRRIRTLMNPPYPAWLVHGPWNAPALSPLLHRDPPPVFQALEQARRRIVGEVGAGTLARLEHEFAHINSDVVLNKRDEAPGAMLMYLVMRRWMKGAAETDPPGVLPTDD